EVPSFRKGDLSILDRIETPHASTVIFHLKEPFAPFLANLNVGILPQGAGKDVGSRPGGTGPYRILELRPAQGIVPAAREPFAPFLANLNVGILPQGAGKDVGSRPVGTGPYRILELRRDQDIVLTAFSEYFRGKPPCPKIPLQ